MEVSVLPLSPSQRSKLVSAGYTTISSLSRVSPPDLVHDLNISHDEAAQILKVALQSRKVDHNMGRNNTAIVTGAQTAWEMLHEEEFVTRITTSCGDLDAILGGGINLKEVTEIGGVPGIGKTQLGIQLAINVQLPVDYGGLGGKAIYIDTEGSFMVDRVFQIAKACIEDMVEGYAFRQKQRQTCNDKLQPKTFLTNIFYFRVCSYTEQLALINYLEKFITENKDVKVVIIDSITFHFRQDFDDFAMRTRVLSGMALKLMKLAKKFSLAEIQLGSVYYKVVLLNQVTNKFTEGSFHLTLALGDSWSHACTNRVILYWNGNERYAYIEKSPSLRSASAPYSVTSKGIRNASSHYKRTRMM